MLVVAAYCTLTFLLYSSDNVTHAFTVYCTCYRVALVCKYFSYCVSAIFVATTTTDTDYHMPTTSNIYICTLCTWSHFLCTLFFMILKGNKKSTQTPQKNHHTCWLSITVKNCHVSAWHAPLQTNKTYMRTCVHACVFVFHSYGWVGWQSNSTLASARWSCNNCFHMFVCMYVRLCFHLRFYFEFPSQKAHYFRSLNSTHSSSFGAF